MDDEEIARPAPRRHTIDVAPGPEQAASAVRMAEKMGLMEGPKTKHLNAKVPPRLFEAAARRVGTDSPAAVITAALASLAVQSDLGPWLAANWGVLSDLDPEILDQIYL
jgi:hypothetical protein